MAKSKLHFPIKSTTTSSRSGALSLGSPRSLEGLSSQIHSNLSKYVFPRLCRSCKLMCQRRLHPTTVRLPPYLNDNKQNDLSVWDSLCIKCRLAISNISRDNSSNAIASKSISTTHTAPFRINRKAQNSLPKPSPLPAGAASLLAQKFKDLISVVYSYGSALSSPIRSSSPQPLMSSVPSSPPESPLHLTLDEYKTASESNNLLNEGSVYSKLVRTKKEWCHFCGSSVASKWYPGPWGPRTLCYKHSDRCKGIDRLDLSSFNHENQRKEPVVRDYCGKCWNRLDVRTSSLRCNGCPFAYHVGCVPPLGSKTLNSKWFCSSQCILNHQTCSVNVNLPFNALAPFIEVEIVSEPGELPTFPTRKRKYSHNEDSDDDFNVENKIPRRTITGMKEFPAPPLLSPPKKIVEIPVPGVVKHVLCASKRYFSAQVASFGGKKKIPDERIDDYSYLDRHRRYESTEVSSRICRPVILRKLLTPKK